MTSLFMLTKHPLVSDIEITKSLSHSYPQLSPFLPPDYLFLLRPVTNSRQRDFADMTIHDTKADTGFPDPTEDEETLADLICAQSVKDDFRPAVRRVQFPVHVLARFFMFPLHRPLGDALPWK
jgi:hypothetical protein